MKFGSLENWPQTQKYVPGHWKEHDVSHAFNKFQSLFELVRLK